MEMELEGVISEGFWQDGTRIKGRWSDLILL